jgi:ssDNA thymidine ADP-ribosyltransferase, DarT
MPMSEIAILVTSLPTLREQGVPFLFTERHEYLGAAQFFDYLAELSRNDWSSLRARDFASSADDLGKIEPYQAEALVHHHVPVAARGPEYASCPPLHVDIGGAKSIPHPVRSSFQQESWKDQSSICNLVDSLQAKNLPGFIRRRRFNPQFTRNSGHLCHLISIALRHLSLL